MIDKDIQGAKLDHSTTLTNGQVHIFPWLILLRIQMVRQKIEMKSWKVQNLKKNLPVLIAKEWFIFNKYKEYLFDRMCNTHDT